VVHALRVTLRMHPDELDVPVTLVRRLVDTQFPRWADAPLLRVPVWGTDNAMYRLGDDLVVRLPRRPGNVEGLAKELRWLPRLAPLLPVPVPAPVATGEPGDGYPLPWAVFRWLDATPALEAEIDYEQLAVDLARFVAALQAVEAPEELVPGSRGVPLAERDEPIRARIPELAGDVDVRAVTAVWEHALAAPVWHGPPVWMHGDLMPTNLLIRGGGLAGVVDWGACTTGDPACEALLAWMTLDAPSRTTFRELLGLDDATWARARGWALSCAVMALPYYRHTYPVLAEVARRTFAQVLADDLE
jgi:aminoglycoside phosphotransferase (APT) family kinase protein